MKKIIFVFSLVFLFNSCGKPGVTPQTMEDVIVGKKWWNTSDEEGMLLDEDGSFYLLKVCEPESLIGKWILEEDLIKLRFYVNSIEYTMLVAEVTSYTATELKVKAETTDTNITANYVFTTDFEEVYGCTDNSANNYNADVMCDDGSCSYCTLEECTFIPDDAFEQLLINLGYDDVLDDYVKTENIENVTSLNLSGGYPVDDFDDCCGIYDVTGLDGFISLRYLYLDGSINTLIDVSNLPSLISIKSDETGMWCFSLKANNSSLISIEGCGTFDLNGAINLNSFKGFYMSQSPDFSTNVSLETLVISDSNFPELDISSNTEITELSLNYIYGLNCIQVHDTSWANNIPLLDLGSENQMYFSTDCGN